MAFNKEHNITPKTIIKPVTENLLELVNSYRNIEDIVAHQMADMNVEMKDLPKVIDKLEKEMHKAAKLLDFEQAAEIRDKLKKLRELNKMR